jgi:thiol-disulfide isomerase/thioredoxin
MDRRRILRLVVLAIAAVALIVGLRQWAARHVAHLPSRPAYDFEMQQLNGAPLRLSDFRGKVILLDFWASWCTPCREEIPRLVEWQSQYGGRGLQVIGVTMDENPADAERFSHEFKINYPVVAGSVKLTDQFGGIFGLPANIVIARDGKIVARHAGLVDLSLLQRELTTQLASGGD